MAQALRVISVQRGLAPGAYSLTCFGGAGGLHVCELAELLGMDNALVPIHGGVLSALGMLVAPPSRQLSHAFNRLLAECSNMEIESALDSLAAQGRTELEHDGITEMATHYSLDLRYEGQSSTLRLPWQDITSTLEAFHQQHESRYGHRLDIPVEVVNLRAGLEGRQDPPPLPRLETSEPAEPVTFEDLQGCTDPVPVYDRLQLMAEQELSGPSLITEKVSTTMISSGWSCRVDDYGNLILSRS
jgi:N-methylhydantoinase A